MKRTTLMLPAELKRRAMARAAELGISFGELVRGLLEERLSRPGRDAGQDPLFADKAVYTGDAPADLSADHDRYLYGEDE